MQRGGRGEGETETKAEATHADGEDVWHGQNGNVWQLERSQSWWQQWQLVAPTGGNWPLATGNWQLEAGNWQRRQTEHNRSNLTPRELFKPKCETRTCSMCGAASSCVKWHHSTSCAAQCRSAVIELSIHQQLNATCLDLTLPRHNEMKLQNV